MSTLSVCTKTERRRDARALADRNMVRGFSIIELMVVVTLLAIVSAYAIPKLNTSKTKAQAGATLLLTLLQSSQRNAITRQSNVIVSFDTVYNRLRIVEDYNNNDTLNTTDRVVWRKIEEGVHFQTPPMGRVTGAAATAGYAGSDLRTVSALPGVIFRRDGSASSDAELYVTLRNTEQTEYRALVVAKSTGRVDMYKWTGTAWLKSTR